MTHRIVVFGNSGSGKSTMAGRLSVELAVPHLDLDQLAWSSPGVRRPLTESAREIEEFALEHHEWVVEGCYADLLDMLLPRATELRFLNPGIETCIANCRNRPWEPHKYSSKADQDANLDFLIRWVRDYETRTDEYSLARHRTMFEQFTGRKREYTGQPGTHDSCG